jgi:hypothetical protein
MLIELTCGNENHFQESTKTVIFTRPTIDTEEHFSLSGKKKLVKILNKRSIRCGLQEGEGQVNLYNVEVPDGLILKIYTCYIKDIRTQKLDASLYLRCRAGADLIEITSKTVNKNNNIPNYYFRGNFDVLKESALNELGIAKHIPSTFYYLNKDSRVENVFSFNILKRGDSAHNATVVERVTEDNEIVRYKKLPKRNFSV